MPYSTVADLPEQTSGLTQEQKKRFLAAFNSAHESGKSEKSAIRIAWAAAKGDEVGKHLLGRHDQQDHDPTKGSHARDDHEGLFRSDSGSEDSWTDTQAGEFAQNMLAIGALIVGAGAAGRVLRYGAPRVFPHANASTFADAHRTFGSGHRVRRLTDVKDSIAPLPGQRGTIAQRDWRALEGRNYNETISNVERTIRGGNTEIGAVIDPRGKIVSMTYGDRGSFPIAVPMRMRRSVRNQYTYTHNHPGANVPLSGADISLQERYGFGVARAVLPNGTVSQMTYNASGNIAGQVRGSYQTTNMVKNQINYIRNAGLSEASFTVPRIQRDYNAFINGQYRTMAQRNPNTWGYELFENLY